MTEQEIILTSILKCRRVDLYTKGQRLSKDERNRLSAIDRLRRAKEPLQYILNCCEFMGLEFFVDRRVLIPRPETELLVQAAGEAVAKNSKKSLRILDIGTGSGNIIISLAKKFPKNKFYAVDISPDALEVAQKNAQAHNVAKQIRFIEADVTYESDFLKREEKFDIIISNPPYIKTGDLATLQEEVRREPRFALDGGDDGLYFYRLIAKVSKRLLASDGILLLEIGFGQEEDIKEILMRLGCLKNVEILKDYSEIKRIIIAKRK